MPLYYPNVTSLLMIRNEVRKLLNEPVAVFWSDDELDSWIRHSCVEISRHSLGIERKSAIALTGAIEYNFAIPGEKITRLYTVLYSDSGSFNNDVEGLAQIHPQQIKHLAQDGTPKFYYLFAGLIGIYPDNAVGTVYVYHSVTSDQPMSVPEELQTLIILHTVFLCRLKERKNQEAAMFFSYYVNALRQYRADIFERPPDTKEKFQMGDRTVIRGA